MEVEDFHTQHRASPADGCDEGRNGDPLCKAATMFAFVLRGTPLSERNSLDRDFVGTGNRVFAVAYQNERGAVQSADMIRHDEKKGWFDRRNLAQPLPPDLV
jgi:hypothetical protein